jgi:SPP1 gp7 family putative phage head morphogenesis protein
MKLSGIQYNVVLQRMIKVLKRDIDEEIVPLIRQYTADSAIVITVDAWSDIVAAALKRLIDRWNSPYNQRIANDIASKFVNTALERNKSFGFDVFQNSQELIDYTKAASWQNAQLITSINSQYLTQVSNIVMGNMRQGMRPSYIVQQLQEQYGITQRRAKMIARDQTAKITGEVTKLRQQQAGFKYFRWLDSHDQRVRHRHKEIADKETAYGKGVYKWTELPLSDNGEPIQPGSDFQCRCTAVPVSDAAVEKFQKSKSSK